MIPVSLQILGAVLVGLALIALVIAVLIWRRTSGASPRLIASAERLERRAETLPQVIGVARADLAERTATIEHALWLLTRADTRLEGATAALRQRRAGMEELRGKLERNRARAETLKSTARLIMKALELRRTFL